MEKPTQELLDERARLVELKKRNEVSILEMKRTGAHRSKKYLCAYQDLILAQGEIDARLTAIKAELAGARVNDMHTQDELSLDQQKEKPLWLASVTFASSAMNALMSRTDLCGQLGTMSDKKRLAEKAWDIADAMTEEYLKRFE